MSIDCTISKQTLSIIWYLYFFFLLYRNCYCYSSLASPNWPSDAYILLNEVGLRNDMGPMSLVWKICIIVKYGFAFIFIVIFDLTFIGFWNGKFKCEKKKTRANDLVGFLGSLKSLWTFGLVWKMNGREKKNFFAWWFVIKKLVIGYYVAIPRQIGYKEKNIEKREKKWKYFETNPKWIDDVTKSNEFICQ